MTLDWMRKLRRRPRAAAIDDATWARTLAAHPFLARLAEEERARLRALAEEFIARKSFSAAAGFALDDAVVVAIAAQACLPVLHLGLAMFDDFSEVIVYPGEFFVRREQMDDTGVVHDVSGALSGETMPGGPVVISWEDARIGLATADAGSARPAYNVVIHEFVHKLDLAAGNADGLPVFHPRLHAGLDPQTWCEVLDAAYDRFCGQVDDLEDRFPRHLDPESDAGQAIYDRLPLDAYAADDPAEFFAVASEAYFVAPERLRRAFGALYEQLDRYYRPPAVTAARPSPRSRSGSSG